MRLLEAVRRRLPRARVFVMYAASPGKDGGGALARLGCGMEPITADNVAGAAEFRKPEVVAMLARYVERGCEGFFVTRDGERIAHGFLHAPKDRPEVLRRAKVYPGEAALFLEYVRPEHRGRGIASALHAELAARAFETRAAKQAVSWTAPGNKASRRVQEKAGGARAGTLFIFECFGRPLLRLTFGSSVKR